MINTFVISDCICNTHDYALCTNLSGVFSKREFVTYRKGQLDKVLYPRYKVCRAPREKPEKIKQKSIQNTVKTTEVSWAELLSIYSADSGSEIFNWDIWKKEVDPNKATRWNQLWSIMRFTSVFFGVVTIFVFLVPIVGRCGFKFYSLIWFAICHPELRRIGRRIFIMVYLII